MKKYESVVLLESKLKNEQLKCISEKICKIINDFGKVTKIESLGIKKLAYEVKKNQEAYYMVFEFETDNNDENTIRDLERFYRITEEIIKFIVVKRD